MDAGADVNAVQPDRFTPLHGAAQDGQMEMIQLLLAHGADPRAKRHTMITPADMAHRSGHGDIADLLASA